MLKPDLIIIGVGLSGSEAAWQAAQRGLRVRIYEMRPKDRSRLFTQRAQVSLETFLAGISNY
jgi:folate-dependent tRNA-U54 methylase TrmFO/GidA